MDLTNSYNLFADEYVPHSRRNFFRYINIILNLISGKFIHVTLVILIIWRYMILLDIHKIRLGKIADKGKTNNLKQTPCTMLA